MSGHQGCLRACWLVALKALERGLAVDPNDRFASMTELLRQLEPRRRRGLPWAIAAWIERAATKRTGHGAW